jgi:hypothetical protein
LGLPTGAAIPYTFGKEMNQLASTVSGLDPPLLVAIIIVLAVSPLADIWTRSFFLLTIKILILVAGSYFGPPFLKEIPAIWFVSLLFGLSIVSFLRAAKKFNNSKKQEPEHDVGGNGG